MQTTDKKIIENLMENFENDIVNEIEEMEVEGYDAIKVQIKNTWFKIVVEDDSYFNVSVHTSSKCNQSNYIDGCGLTDYDSLIEYIKDNI